MNNGQQKGSGLKFYGIWLKIMFWRRLLSLSTFTKMEALGALGTLVTVD